MDTIMVNPFSSFLHLRELTCSCCCCGNICDICASKMLNYCSSCCYSYSYGGPASIWFSLLERHFTYMALQPGKLVFLGCHSSNLVMVLL